MNNKQITIIIILTSVLTNVIGMMTALWRRSEDRIRSLNKLASELEDLKDEEDTDEFFKEINRIISEMKKQGVKSKKLAKIEQFVNERINKRSKLNQLLEEMERFKDSKE